jgi:hypothetical protein
MGLDQVQNHSATYTTQHSAAPNGWLNTVLQLLGASAAVLQLKLSVAAAAEWVLCSWCGQHTVAAAAAAAAAAAIAAAAR